MSKNNDAEVSERNDLLSFLLDMRNGQVVCDINEKFNEVVKAVVETGGKGELTIKLLVNPSKFAMGGAVVEIEAEHTCKAKSPELKIGKAMFFVGKTGRLTREHPDQAGMFELDNPKQEKA